MSKYGKEPEICPDCGGVHIEDKELQAQINMADDFVEFMIFPAIDGYENRMDLPEGLLDSVAFYEIAKRLIRSGQSVETLIGNVQQAANGVATDMDNETFHETPERSQ